MAPVLQDLVFLDMAPVLQRGSSLSSLIFLQDGLFHIVFVLVFRSSERVQCLSGLLFKRACLCYRVFPSSERVCATGFSLQASVFVFIISSFRRAWEADIGGTLLSRSEESSKIRLESSNARSASTPFIFQPGVTNASSNIHHPYV